MIAPSCSQASWFSAIFSYGNQAKFVWLKHACYHGLSILWYIMGKAGWISRQDQVEEDKECVSTKHCFKKFGLHAIGSTCLSQTKHAAQSIEIYASLWSMLRTNKETSSIDDNCLVRLDVNQFLAKSYSSLDLSSRFKLLCQGTNVRQNCLASLQP